MASSQLRRSPPPPTGGGGAPATWSHVETTQLIDAYRQKWYALNRGQLRAHQWEEVAQDVAARCGFDPPSKTATQCRHKIEKLRKRYRSELLAGPASAASWPFFRLMDFLERGPVLPPDCRSPSPDSSSRSSSSSSDDEDKEEEMDKNNTRSIDHILQRPPPVEYHVPRFSRSPRLPKRNLFEKEEDGDGEDRPLAELASAIRSFGEGFVRMETMKMEMMREAEKSWLEMERRRTELILNSQQKIADAIRDAVLALKPNRNTEET